ncbi:MAG: glucose-6-phosphate dehydrogenase, partial [Sedimentisphaerales bacterium]|nr:glucose-6-phosphate dehydrogenase [Sedimentisphaerales bacterium]
MQEIRPQVVSERIICEETPAPPCAMVVFGASGDLTSRKLIPSLFELAKRGLLSEQFYLLGVGRKKLSDEEFRQIAQQAVKQSFSSATANQTRQFIDKLYYTSGDYSSASFYNSIKERVAELNTQHKTGGNPLFYLAVPPILYATVVEYLGSSGLSHLVDSTLRQSSVQAGSPQADLAGSQRAGLVVEKPFGRDLKSAAELNRTIHKYFDETQVYRIDHYLGKETVQNILMFRFANAIFEPVWNRDYIDHIQITVAESLGVEHRGGYYDNTGALRDIFQNHMLQMLSLVAMEPPASFEADCIRDEKVKLLRSVRPFALEPWSANFVRGQYGPGPVDGKKVVGYRDEPGVGPDSKTETFVAAKLFIDNWRWKDVPFYLRTGKRLCAKDTEVAIFFRKVPHSMFVSAGLADIPPNVLILQIQPEEGMLLSFQAKRAGSKICMSTLNMNFSYKDIFGVEMPEAYQRLLLDCMLGDQTLFDRYDSAELS